MVNYHFTSKAGLVEAVVADIRETFIDVLQALPGYARMSGLEAVLAKLDQFFARLAEPEPGVRVRALLVLLAEAVGSADGVKGLMADHLSLVRAGVEEDIRRGSRTGASARTWTWSRRRIWWRASLAAYSCSINWTLPGPAWRISHGPATRRWCSRSRRLGVTTETSVARGPAARCVRRGPTGTGMPRCHTALSPPSTTRLWPVM